MVIGFCDLQKNGGWSNCKRLCNHTTSWVIKVDIGKREYIIHSICLVDICIYAYILHNNVFLLLDSVILLLYIPQIKHVLSLLS